MASDAAQTPMRAEYGSAPEISSATVEPIHLVDRPKSPCRIPLI